MGDKMKKVYLFVLFLVPFLCAQQSNKGYISLVYNGEKIELPVNTINIQKENGIILSIWAERNDSSAQQAVSLQLALNDLSSGPDAEKMEGTKIKITTKDRSADSGKEFYIWFSEDKDKSEARYGILNKGKKQSWGITSVSLEIDITDVKYNEGTLHISGECKGTFKSKDAPEGQIAQIKDGKFEIII